MISLALLAVALCTAYMSYVACVRACAFIACYGRWYQLTVQQKSHLTGLSVGMFTLDAATIGLAFLAGMMT